MTSETLSLLSSISVLIVEDDAIARTMISSALKPYCKGVYVAQDGYDGLDKFNKFNVDIILTDINMPMMNGFEMMKEILKIKPHQKFIIFTSNDTDSNLIKSVQFGATLFLKKPIDIEVLRSMLITITANQSSSSLIKLTDEISIDIQKEKIFKNESEIYLTFLQNKVFWLFAYNLNKLVTYEQIIEFVYENEPISLRAIHNVILRIKKTLGINIKNVSEAGYILSAKS